MIISKKQLIGVVAIGIILAGVVFFIWWVSKGRFIQTTDDAYIGGNITTVASKVSGYISAIEVRDNQSVKKGDIILRIEASYRCLLLGERLSLNILQRMSGIATETARYVEELAGTHTQLLDTRKTAPGLRVLDKMAVKDGGATNHRMGLYDMAMIKDNHIKVAGGITNAVNAVRAHIPAGIKIEVETTNLAEVREALATHADIIMLDNMSDDQIRQAVEIIGGRAKTECSGNVTRENILRLASLGVDYISSGALTHSAGILDLSMKNLRAV